MRSNWTLRQLLATLRGLAIMVALFWALILLQLVPALFRGGLAGLHDQIVRVATAGVSPKNWNIAITRMYLALMTMAVAGCILFLAQKYLARRLALHRGSSGRS